MYLDAVDRRLGPSSYEPEKLRPWPKVLTDGEVKRAFARF
jgi:hypothetical protein